MGIVASVMCHCYQEGKTRPCPFPDEFVADPSALPALSWAEPLDEDDAQDAYDKFRAWLTICCEHPNLNYANEFIASWKGHQTFANAIEGLGASHFPYLHSHLPDGEDGITTPDIAAKMLLELDRFEAQQNLVTHAVLMDSERNEVISMGSQVVKGTLAMDRNTGFDVGFTEEGFFVRDRWELYRVMFQAKRVEQRLLRPELMQVEYVDLDNGRTFQCNTPFGKSMMGEDGLPRMILQTFHVELLPSSENRFAYIILPLRRVLNASVEMGHPVRWH